MDKSKLNGIWSAMPTPLDNNYNTDTDSVLRLMEHQLKLGINGVFIAGTSGEGPWLSEANRIALAKAAVKGSAGLIPVTMQITDNSAQRMIDNAKRYADTGIDMAVIAPPFFQIKPEHNYLVDMYNTVIDAVDLPVGIYNRGKYSSVVVSPETLSAIIENPKVIICKDSAGDPEYQQAILAVRDKRKGELFAFSGDEFNCVEYIRTGYDGLILGGGCFTGAMAGGIFALAGAGKYDEAQKLQDAMNTMMFRVFGGRRLTAWMAGQKEIMKRLGVFTTAVTTLNYSMTDECSKDIDSVLAEFKSYLCC
ncbi:MAG: dihydrodipicolinate synthase family protein [Victivallales bacterium]|nr:dihydrodipicolinate synthase family protein [Victivallales bacterium]